MAGIHYALLQLQRIGLCPLLVAILLYPQTASAQETHNAGYQHLLSMFTQREYGQVIANVEQLRLHSPITVQELQSIYLVAESYFAIGNYQKSKEYTEFWLANYAASNTPAMNKLAPYCKFRLAQLQSRLDDNQSAEQLLKEILSEALPAALEASASLQLAWLTAEKNSNSIEAKSLCDKCLSKSKPTSQDHLSAMLLHAVLSRNSDSDDKARETLATIRKQCGTSEQFQELRYKATVLLLQIENTGEDQQLCDQLVQELKAMRPPSQKLLELAKLESMFATNDEASVDLKARELTTLGQTARDPKVRQRALVALSRMPNPLVNEPTRIEFCNSLLKDDQLSDDLRAEVTFRLADAQCKSGQAKDGVTLLSKSVHSLPAECVWKSPSLLLLAESAFQLEDLPLSRETFTKILNDSKLSRSAEVRYLAILRLGEIAAIEKEWSVAEQFASDLLQATDSFNYAAATNYLLGRIAVSKGEINEAREHLAKAVESSGKETEIAARAQWLIGETYFLQENYTMALQNYAAVLQYDDQPQWCAVSQLQAGKCLEATGDTKGAIAAYQSMIADYPDSIYVDETQQRLTAVQQSGATHVAEAESKNTR